MPSKLQDAPPRFDDPDDEPTPTIASNPFTGAGAVRTSALSPAYPQSSPARPTLRHTASSAAELETPSSGNRHRSGSLTSLTSLTPPQNGLGAAFGTSPFSNAWLANPGLTTGPSRSPLGQPIQPHDDDRASFTSPSDSAASLATDDLQFSTLDYLGLADGSDAQLPPASMTELRNQAQRAIASSGPASRNRASTVSNFGRPQYRPSVTTSSGAAYARDHNPYETAAEDDALQQAIEQLGMYDSPSFGGPYGHFKDPSRPRATTIGTLDQPLGRGGRNAGYLASIPQSPIAGQMGHPYALGAPFGYPPRSHSERDLVRSRDSSSSRGPRMSISSHTSRTGTPDQERGSSTPQMPSRSLWIGNLDVSATSDALLHVFAPYGAIESVRMLPEKVRSHSCPERVCHVRSRRADLRLCKLHGEGGRGQSARRRLEPYGRAHHCSLRNRPGPHRFRQDRLGAERSFLLFCSGRSLRLGIHKRVHWSCAGSARCVGNGSGNGCGCGRGRVAGTAVRAVGSAYESGLDRKYSRYDELGDAAPDFLALWTSRVGEGPHAQGESSSAREIQAHPKRREILLMQPVLWVCQL